jgi:hypothetical protein
MMVTTVTTVIIVTKVTSVMKWKHALHAGLQFPHAFFAG